jgi:hypothetical protein
MQLQQRGSYGLQHSFLAKAYVGLAMKQPEQRRFANITSVKHNAINPFGMQEDSSC